MNMKLAGAVVLYNPNILQVIENIKSYIKEIDVLYVFDNSDDEGNNKQILNNFSLKIDYHSFNTNKGIAFGLNYLAQIALKSGFEWLLTMDQDSSFPSDNGFQQYLNLVSKRLDKHVAMFSPNFSGESVSMPQFYTSGAIMNLNAWSKIKLDEKLFIDEVDGDFTYRLAEANYSLIKISEVALVHELGNQYCRKFLWKKLCSDNHSAMRKYYIARNRIYLIKKRPSMRYIYVVDSFKKFVLFILIEDEKITKMKMIVKGIYHGLIGKMGKYEI